jgi:hypothetical protein
MIQDSDNTSQKISFFYEFTGKGFVISFSHPVEGRNPGGKLITMHPAFLII